MRSSTTFQPGNLVALKHGNRSAQVRETTRKALLGEIRGHLDDLLGEPAHGDALLRDLLADALADVRQLGDYLNRMGGPVSPRGQVYASVDARRSRERDALALLDRLGIGPRARTQILGHVVASEGLASQLAKARLTRSLPPPGEQA